MNTIARRISFIALVLSARTAGAEPQTDEAPAVPKPTSPPPAQVDLPEAPEAPPPNAASENGVPAKPDSAKAPTPEKNAAPASAAPASAVPMVVPPAGPPQYGAVYPAAGSPPAGADVRDVPEHKRLGPLDDHVTVQFNLDTVWYKDKSFDFFSDHDNATSPGVSVGYSIWLDKSLAIVPEIGWSMSSQSASGLFGGAINRTELKAQRAYAGASLRLGLLSFLGAHARVAGGASFLDATVQPSSPNTTLEDTGMSSFVSFGGGLTVHSPAGALETQSGSLRSLLFGVTVEGGYELGGSVDLTPVPTGDTGRIATEYMKLGTLERSGPYFRSSLVVRF